MAVTTIAGAITALRTQVKGQAGTLTSTEARNRVTGAVAQFQTELAALDFPMLGITTPPPVTTLGEALDAMRQQITGQSSPSVNAKIWALIRLDRLTAELSSVGLRVGS